MSALERVKAMLSVVTRLPLNEKERREVADLREVVALAERAAELEARMKSLLEDAQATSDLDDEAHRLLDFALGEGEPETTSMETVAGRLPRLIAERDEARAEVERLRRSLVDLTGDKSAGDLPEKTVLGVLMQRDEARASLEVVSKNASEMHVVAMQLQTERDAARAEAEMLREALMVADGAMNSMGDTLNDMDVAGEMGDFEKVAAAFEVVRTALAATPGDWLAARDRALAERVREVVLAQIAKGRTPNAINLDVLVGGES